MVNKIMIGLVTVFVATFMLFFIFDNIDKLSKKCETEVPKPDICDKLSGFTLTMLIILLIIGGFIITIFSTAYILLAH